MKKFMLDRIFESTITDEERQKGSRQLEERNGATKLWADNE